MFPWEEDQYYYRHRVEVHLALASVDESDFSKTKFALNPGESSLPHKILKRGESTLESAISVFHKLSGINAMDWLHVKQIGVCDEASKDSVVILYGIMVPGLFPIRDDGVKWVDIEELSKHPGPLRMMGLACNYLKVGT